MGGGSLTTEQTIKLILSHLNLIVPVVAAILVIIIAIVVVCVVRGTRDHHKGNFVFSRYHRAVAWQRGGEGTPAVGQGLVGAGSTGAHSGDDCGVYRWRCGDLFDARATQRAAPPARSEGRVRLYVCMERRFILSFIIHVLTAAM